MRSIRVTGMVVISLCWIACVMVSAGATAAPEQFQVQARDAGQGTVSGQAAQQAQAGQVAAQAQNAQSLNTAQKTQAANIQEQGTTGSDAPARFRQTDMANATLSRMSPDASAAGQERPVPSDRLNVTSSGPGPVEGSFAGQAPPDRPGYDNTTAPGPSWTGGDITGIDQFRPAANVTAQPPLPEPDNASGQPPEAGTADTVPAGSNPVPENAGNGNTVTAAAGSQQFSREQVESIIQSFLTWLGAQTVR